MISLAFLTTCGQSGASGCRTINHWQLGARKPYGARLLAFSRSANRFGADLPYVPDPARILINMAQACAELIGAPGSTATDAACRSVAGWYSNQAIPNLRRAFETRTSQLTGGSQS
jgi:hypothetical protein